MSGYIASIGGLSAATYNDNGSLGTLLGGLYATVTTYNQLVNEADAKAMVTDLNTLCRQFSTIPGDIIAVRNACSARALRVTAQAAAAASQLRIVIGDALTVI